MKKKLFTFVVSILIVCTSMGITEVEAATYNGETSVNLNVRVKPDLSGKVYTTLKKNSKVNYATHNSSWVKIYLNGKTYYASKRYIVPIKVSQISTTSTVKTTKGVTTTNVNVRTSPSLSGKVYKTLKKNTNVDYASYNSLWVKVIISGKTYYASKKYVKSVSTTPSSPVTSTPKWIKGILTTNLNIRTSPSLNGKVYKTLKKNTKVDYASYNSSWVRVMISGKTYYASKAYIAPVPQSTEVIKVTGYTTQSLSLYGRQTEGDPVVRQLRKHERIVFSQVNDEWIKVYIGSNVYYAKSSGVAKGELGSNSIGTVYINTPGDVLNVRETASATSRKVGTLKHSTKVEYYGISNGFHKIKFNGQFAYISSAFVISSLNPISSSNAVIVLDPGHGGKDPGAVNGSIYEKTIVLDVTKRVEAYLRSKYGYTVRMTRSRDVYLTLEQRVAAAKSLRGNLFISMHVNALDVSSAKGMETYYSTRSAHSARSRVLASNIQSNLASKMSGMSNRGVKTANYHVITYNTMPSALVELGFISSPTDLTYLRSDVSRQRMAEGVAEGIAKYVRTYH